MRLTLAYHPVTAIRFGATTQLQGTVLEVSEAALRQYLLEDRRLQRVDLATVYPGEACRFGVVFDIIEPRAKEAGAGPDFPGILGPIARVGQGITHVLPGAAVTVLDPAAPVTGGQVVEMSGDAGKACPYAALAHLVVVPHVVSGLERHRALHALRLASIKATVHLGRTAVRHPPANTGVFESLGPVEASRSGLPRLAYIGQIHSRQRVAEVDEQILYGANTAGMAPVPLHPNEWLDGALVTSYFNRAVETYFYQNHPVIIELYRWHREGKITLVGTIATMAGSDNDERARNAMLAAHQAKWSPAAEGIILTKYGGGAPHADIALTAELCEELGMRTAVQASDMSQDRRAEEEAAHLAPYIHDGAVGPGRLFEQVLGAGAQVVRTIVVGDNYAAEHVESLSALAVQEVQQCQADLFVAGPCFEAGRYGIAAGAMCKAVKAALGVPVITGMAAENPGVDMYRSDIHIVDSGTQVQAMRDVLTTMVRLAWKFINHQAIGRPREEGYIPQGILRDDFVEPSAAERLVAMVYAKTIGQPFESEFTPPTFSSVPAPAPVLDLSKARVALVTDGGLVPKGNPDRISPYAATNWGAYGHLWPR